MTPMHIAKAARLQRGLGLVEIMVAMVIALFLLAGLYSIFMTTRTTYAAQTQLTRLQDDERLANSLITDVVQSAGYFPDPQAELLSSALPASPPFAAAQAVTGNDTATAQGDSITVRYKTATGDGILNCVGDSNTTGAMQVYVNTFSVDATNGLQCVFNGGAPQTLVPAVQSMQVLYGVYGGGGGFSAQYMNATAVTASSNWPNVRSVRISLTFANPLYPQPGQPQNINFVRTIAIMNKS